MNNTTPKPGIYEGISFEEYLSWNAISQSDLKKIYQCPAQWKYSQEHPEAATKAMQIGSAVHAYILDPHLFIEQVAVEPKGINKRTNAGKDEYEHFLSQNLGKIVVKHSDLDLCKAMRQAMLSNENAEQSLSGKHEISFVWQEPDTGLLCKSRLDATSEQCHGDLKTTKDASAWAFQRDMMKYGYHVQAAFYTDGWEALNGNRPPFHLVAIEKAPPYVNVVYQVGDATLMLGRRAYMDAIELYQRCLAENYWPGYHIGIEILSAPKWAWEEELED